MKESTTTLARYMHANVLVSRTTRHPLQGRRDDVSTAFQRSGGHLQVKEESNGVARLRNVMLVYFHSALCIGQGMPGL
jgi:hypothetical protein